MEEKIEKRKSDRYGVWLFVDQVETLKTIELKTGKNRSLLLKEACDLLIQKYANGKNG